MTLAVFKNRKNMKTFLLALAVFGFMGQLYAQNKLSLADAIALALKNNYSVVIERNNQTKAENNNSWGMAGAYPTINFTTTAQNQMAIGDESYMRQLNPSINLNWTIFSGFRIRSTKHRLEDVEELMKSTTQQRIENTVKDVILAYYGSLMEAERLKLNQNVMFISRDRYVAAQTRKEFGAAVTFDVLQAKNDYLSDSAAYLSQRQNYSNSLRLLSFLLADTTNVKYELSEKFETEMQEYLLTDLINRMEANNKTLRMQRLSMEMASKDIKIAQSSLYPTLSLNTGVNYALIRSFQPGMQQAFINEGLGWTGNLTLSWTLFNGGNRRRQIQNAKIDYSSAQLSVEQLRHNFTNQIANQLETYEVRKELLNVSLEAEKTAELNLQIAREKFENGAINSFNYRDVQTLYMTTAQNRLLAVFNLVNSQVELMRLIGEIVNDSQQ